MYGTPYRQGRDFLVPDSFGTDRYTIKIPLPSPSSTYWPELKGYVLEGLYRLDDASGNSGYIVVEVGDGSMEVGNTNDGYEDVAARIVQMLATGSIPMRPGDPLRLTLVTQGRPVYGTPWAWRSHSYSWR